MLIPAQQPCSESTDPRHIRAQLMHSELALAATSKVPAVVSVLERHEAILSWIEQLDLSVLAPAPDSEIRDAIVFLSARCTALRRIDASGLSLEIGNWTYFCALFPQKAKGLREVILRDTNVLSIYVHYFIERLPELQLLDLRGIYRMETFYAKRKGVTILLSEAPPFDSIP